MQLANGAHLAYCTNIHAGESWEATRTALTRYVMSVRERVCKPLEPYAIGLRLGAQAASDLQADGLDAFRAWLAAQNCYVFTINGFPYGSFHNRRVKEQVYAPDWATGGRFDYTMRLFDILSAILPAGVDGSVSTVPVSFKAFTRDAAHHQAALTQLRRCAKELERRCDRTGQDLHLGLEPEPLCVIESTDEAVNYFDELVDGLSTAEREVVLRRIGINYDTCHLACEFEDARTALDRLAGAGIRISKLHLSSALRLPDPATHAACLAPFVEETYLHQVIGARDGKIIFRLPDLDEALAMAGRADFDCGDEWRVHFHLPLHAAPERPIHDTRDGLLGALDWLAEHPGTCRHLEMETYTWNVLPAQLKSDSVVDQLCREYAWTLRELAARGLTTAESA